MKWRLGIDLGTNSLGWAAFELAPDGTALKPAALMDAGSRIFSDGRNPKDKQSNAVKRREPRGARRNRDRYLRRRARLMRQLIEYGLMPKEAADRKALEGGKGIPLTESDPWILRARGLSETLTLPQLGRAIFHLHQRRGFKSNRKTDRGDSESGKVYDAIAKTKAALKDNNARTLGELFGARRLETHLANQTLPKGARAAQPLARVRKSGEGAKWGYDYYPTRDLILDEFDQLWDAQAVFHDEALTQEARAEFRNTIEWQHPLKSPPVGKCTLMPEHERSAKALPSSQYSRILQEVNALKVGQAGKGERRLTDDERGLIIDSLRYQKGTTKKGDLAFSKIKTLIDVPRSYEFNTESEKRKHLLGDQTAAHIIQKDRWGPEWISLDLAVQDEIVDRLINEEKEAVLVEYLTTEHGLDAEQALRVADCPLPDSYGRLSKPALDKLRPELERGLIYSEAATQVFGSHSEFGTGEIFDTALPYYGYILERNVAFGSGDPKDSDEKRYGKVANPTVHVALNQIRKVVNDLMKRFGAPEQIVLELARDLPLSAEGKRELEKRQKDNQTANEKRAKDLAEIYKQSNTYANRMRLRLYEDLDALDKRCIFSGDQIGVENLFSDAVEIEHILPFSRTFDDSYSNKTLSMRRANRDKGNRTPYEAFSDSPDSYDWEEISKRASELPASKKWRFGPDAMERFEKEGGFLARQLTDTQYIARLAKAYVEAIYGGQGQKGSKNHVWVIPGRLTADLRYQWGLDSVLFGNADMNEVQKKNRNDHRHHAIDAIVVGCTDRAMLSRAAKRASDNERKDDDRLMTGIREPWPSFRDDVKRVVQNIVVSHKPDHGIQGAMHNDTAYGIPKGKEGRPDKNGVRKVVTRKPLDGDSFKVPKDLEKIRDHYTKVRLLEAVQGLTGADFKTALLIEAASFNPPVKKVRIEENLRVIPFTDKDRKQFKAYKGDGNYCYDIWSGDKGKWTGEVISTFEAYQLARKDKKWWQKPLGRENQILKMRLRKGDMLQITNEDTRESKIVQIYQFSNGKINMAENFEADSSSRVKSKDLQRIQMSPTSLQKAKAKRVTISPSGVVNIYNT